MKAIINGKIVLKDGVLENKALVFDDKITGIVDAANVQADEIMDAQGLYVAPGFVDVHIHGYLGEDASDGSDAGLRHMAEGILQNGVTSFLPTTMTVAWDELEAAFAAIRRAMAESLSPDWIGAQVLGCHAEGPFINPAKKGAQAAEAILAPDAQKMLAHKDIMRMVTLAPEMAGGVSCVRDLCAGGITVSLGHTDATFEQAQAALDAGAMHMTHTFNAMSALSHRAPGVVGAALCSDAYTELIADTFHIHPGLFRLFAKAKGEKLVLITDCTRAGGLQDGEYTLGGQPIFVKGIECRLQDGTIAGSVLKMNDAVRNYRDHAGVPFHEAINCASLYAARSIGVDACKGSLEAGKDADIVLLDGACGVHGVFVGGVKKV